jgi:hypothetical protein
VLNSHNVMTLYEEFISKLVETVPKSHSYHSLLARGLYYFQLMPYLVQRSINQLKIILTKEIEGTSEKVQKMENIDVAPKHI